MKNFLFFGLIKFLLIYYAIILQISGHPTSNLQVIHNRNLNEIPSNESPARERPTHPMDNPEWVPPVGPTEELDQNFWLRSGRQLLEKQLEKNKLNLNKAKNVIIFIGDGLSIPTQAATRVYMGGEEINLSFEEFPYTGLAKTYCVNYQVSDSACTATAFLAGIKNNYGTLGVSASVSLADCQQSLNSEHHVDNIFKWAQDAGKSTGIVTTTRITHATPAATYAIAADREWENDSETPSDCIDIAYQLVHGDIGKQLNVIFGGGLREFLPHNDSTISEAIGLRTDNRNLINEWINQKREHGAFVQTKIAMDQLNPMELDYMFGLFHASHMNYHPYADPNVEPTLEQMAQKAIELLQKNKDGFVLLIEGGLIDRAHHATLAQLALEETVQFQNAVHQVKSMLNSDDTLIVVTADHSHTMTIGGYPIRGNNILAKGDFSREDEMPFFTLNYANGMGYFHHFYAEESGRTGRINPLGMDYKRTDFEFPATVPLDYETHGGDDVAVYAIGPWAHLFSGNYEQHYIAHAIAYAACIGPDPELCGTNDSSIIGLKSSFLLFMATILALEILI